MDSKHQQLFTRYQHARKLSRDIVEPLQPEDLVIQSMPDASPIKWHLAHTSWFFETFLLKPFLTGYRPFQSQFEYLFNSYYNHVGPQYLRKNRGLISRPTVTEVQEYRQYVDDNIATLLTRPLSEATLNLLELGINHEQQHQELMLTDIKHAFSFNPLFPALADHQPQPQPIAALNWQEYAGGEQMIGYRGTGFHFDNEGPAHPVLLPPFKLATRLITNGELQDFVDDGGYKNPLLWLSDGWAWLQGNAIAQPLYWQQMEGQWHHYTLSGLRPLLQHEPACHLSYYEADAYAQWCGKRLPTECEWEVAAQQQPLDNSGLHLGRLHPHCGTDTASAQATLQQLYGSCWQWTQSAYSPYPGFKPATGAVGEYNGKFMCNQLVLKGSSCVTPQGHSRASYRNFFPAHAQWQFTGIRMADDV